MRMPLKKTSTFLSYRGFLHGLFDTIVSRRAAGKSHHDITETSLKFSGLVEMAEQLLSNRGESSGVARAARLLASYENAAEPEKLSFLLTLATRLDRKSVV